MSCIFSFAQWSYSCFKQLWSPPQRYFQHHWYEYKNTHAPSSSDKYTRKSTEYLTTARTCPQIITSLLVYELGALKKNSSAFLLFFLGLTRSFTSLKIHKDSQKTQKHCWCRCVLAIIRSELLPCLCGKREVIKNKPQCSVLCNVAGDDLSF